jgi:hypothetical protein
VAVEFGALKLDTSDGRLKFLLPGATKDELKKLLTCATGASILASPRCATSMSASRTAYADVRTVRGIGVIAQRALKRSREIDARQRATRHAAGKSPTLPQIDVPRRQ